MKKFRVTIEETVVYKIVVEAEDEEQAKAMAEEVFVQSEHINEFFSHVPERDAIDVEEVEE
jgi:DpnD/PcfM-like protein